MKRRDFIKTAGAASAFFIVPRHVLGRGYKAPSDKLNIACVGIGGMGAYNLKNCDDENIVALCDVDFKFAEGVFEKYPKASRYKDYREMLDEEEDNIDAVIVATPDHTHFQVTMDAMKLGKHVYTQKPLTHTVEEARKLTAAAHEYKVVTQMGNQGHSSEHIRLMKEWIEDGAIGEIKDVYAWTNRPVGGSEWSNFYVNNLPTDTPDVPDGLDWDLWLGPAPERAYHPSYHPGKWRSWYDFGTGSLGDMGCHIVDPVFWALNLGNPIRIQATSTHYKDELEAQTFPRAAIVRYEFPQRGNLAPVNLNWYDGRLLPPIPKELEGRDIPSSGAIIKGTNGLIMHGSHGAVGMRIYPEEKMKEYKRPEKTIARIKGSHEEDWIRACKEGYEGTPPSSNFDYGGPLTEMVLLGMIAIRVKNTNLEWDDTNMQFTNSSDANDLVSKEYRDCW